VIRRLLVVGGDAAGMSAASVARRRTDRADLDVIAFERGRYTSYSACGLPYLVADIVDDVDALIARSPEEHRANGIDVRTAHEVLAIDTDARVARVRNLETDIETDEAFDALVIATGAIPVRPDLPGVDAVGVHGIQTLTDGLELRDHVTDHTQEGQRAVVVGGGYIGLELAEALHQRGMPVTVVDANEQPMTTLDPEIGELVAQALRHIGIDVRCECRVTAFEADEEGHVRAVVTEHETLPADIVVLGLGVRPNVALAQAAGIAIGETGGIKVDTQMRTSVDGIWAAGDCIETVHRVTGQPVRIALGTHANKEGRVAGENATGGNARFDGVVGTAVTKVCAYEIGRTGLTEREANEAGFDAAATTIESTTRAGYYPGAQPITVKVVAERGTGRLLGAQIIGREGAAKRIDVLATAIWAGLTVTEVAELDLGYAPPFSPVWDPVIIAARRAQASIARA
jgi:NADPH-dependent 2,4-dienoyl-CoA reductase/sulfur reductase-like enzyme